MSVFGAKESPKRRGPLADIAEALHRQEGKLVGIDSDLPLGKMAKPIPQAPSAPEPLTPEAQAIINKGLIAEIHSFRDKCLDEYQRRVDAATHALKLADEITQKMVARVEQMAEENARQIAALDSNISALVTLANTLTQVPRPTEEKGEWPSNQQSWSDTAPPNSTPKTAEPTASEDGTTSL